MNHEMRAKRIYEFHKGDNPLERLDIGNIDIIELLEKLGVKIKLNWDHENTQKHKIKERSREILASVKKLHYLGVRYENMEIYQYDAIIVNGYHIRYGSNVILNCFTERDAIAIIDFLNKMIMTTGMKYEYKGDSWGQHVYYLKKSTQDYLDQLEENRKKYENIT